MNIGGFTRLHYDKCAYAKQLQEETSPLDYQLYEGKFENCGKCVYDKFYRPFDLVDVESELRNQTRRASRCPQNDYNPKCRKNARCMSTFDKSAPIILPSDVCPIVFNNIPRRTDPGFRIPKDNICSNKVV